MAKTDRAVFRMPLAALTIPVLAFLCVTPLATVGRGWLALYVAPVLALVYVVFTRTVADRSGLRTTGPYGLRRITWTDLDQLEFRPSRWATAVAADGRRVRLPMVRPRDLPRIVAVSGGRLALDTPEAGGAEAITPELDGADATSAAEGAQATPEAEVAQATSAADDAMASAAPPARAVTPDTDPPEDTGADR